MKNPVLNFVYFTSNYPHDFIEKAFAHDPRLAQHFQSKFSFAKNNVYKNSQLAMLKLIQEMSRDNQDILIQWIADNYHNN